MSVTCKVLIDTNTFDYLYDNQLSSHAKRKIQSNELRLFTTYIQHDEINEIPDCDRKEALIGLITELSIEILLPYGVWGGGESKRGYKGGKWGQMKWGGGNDPLDDLHRKGTESHPLGNRADLFIIRCAANEKMDYLVTDNIEDFKGGWRLLKEKECTRFELLTNRQFHRRFLI